MFVLPAWSSPYAVLYYNVDVSLDHVCTIRAAVSVCRVPCCFFYYCYSVVSSLGHVCIRVEVQDKSPANEERIERKSEGTKRLKKE